MKKLDEIITKITKPFTCQRYIVYWGIIYLFAVLGLYDFTHTDIIMQPKTVIWLYVLMVAALKATVFIILLWYTRKRKWLHVVVWMLISIFCALCLINGVSFSLYGIGISNHMLIVMAQTNVQEIKEFIPGLVDNLVTDVLKPQFIIGILAVVAFIYSVVRYANRTVFSIMIYGCSLLGVILIIMGLFLLGAGRTSIFTYTRTLRSVILVSKEQHQLKEMMAHVQKFPHAESLKTQRLADICFIIGESASRTHMSLYGYPINTCPKMLNKRDSLFVFTDAISSSTSTVYNMERLLTFMTDDETRNKWYQYPLLVDLFKNAGYKVWWLSNQERTGFWSNGSAPMVRNADVKIYRSLSLDDNMIVTYDGDLLEYASNVFTDKSRYKFINMHLMGSHTDYKKRYPADYDYFNGDTIKQKFDRPWLNDSKVQKVAEYDNSIRYTDYVVDSMINMVSKASRPTLLLYVSDHGENVYDDRDFVGRDDKSVKVPFVIYVNTRFRNLYPELTAVLNRAKDRPISTGDIIYMLMTVTGTTYSYYDPTRDALSDRFKPRHRYVNGKPWSHDHIK